MHEHWWIAGVSAAMAKAKLPSTVRTTAYKYARAHGYDPKAKTP